METIKIDLDYLEMCRDLQAKMDETMELLRSATAPLLTDIRLVKPICDVVREEMGEKETNSIVVRAQVFIILYLFSTAKLIGKDCSRSKVLNEVVRLTGVDKSTISRYKSEVIDYYKLNKPFRAKVDRAFSAVSAKFF